MSFNEAIDEIRDGFVPSTEEEEATTPEGSEQETPEQPEVEVESKSEEEPDNETGDDTPEEDQDKSFIEIDGERYTLDQLREWRASGLRQADYTRKTQEVAKLRERLASQNSLRTRIRSNQLVGQMVSTHPELEEYMVENPEATEILLSNDAKAQEFWDEYEVIKQNPNIRERFLEKAQKQDPAAERDLAEFRARKNMAEITRQMDGAISSLAKEYGVGQDVMEKVGERIVKMAGIPLDDNADFNSVLDGFTNVFQMHFKMKDGQYVVDDRILRQLFELSVTDRKVAEEDTKQRAAAHNDKVDKALSTQPKPKSPKGSAPAGEPEKMKLPSNFAEALDELRGGMFS